LHDLFAELARDQSLGLVVVTHNLSLAARADRALSLEGGRLVLSDVHGGGLMLCDNCKERDAVVHLTRIVDNAVTQLHLCEKCAAAKGVETTLSVPQHPLGDILQAVQQQAAAARARTAACARSAGPQRVTFRATGRLGCPHCYDAMERSLRELLRRLHGSSAARGAALRGAASRIGRQAGHAARSADRLRRAVETPSSSSWRRSFATASGCSE
jgi:protein arginine kinase activator